jgi:hypothetical protein
MLAGDALASFGEVFDFLPFWRCSLSREFMRGFHGDLGFVASAPGVRTAAEPCLPE